MHKCTHTLHYIALHYIAWRSLQHAALHYDIEHDFALYYMTFQDVRIQIMCLQRLPLTYINLHVLHGLTAHMLCRNLTWSYSLDHLKHYLPLYYMSWFTLQYILLHYTRTFAQRWENGWTHRRTGGRRSINISIDVDVFSTRRCQV